VFLELTQTVPAKVQFFVDRPMSRLMWIFAVCASGTYLSGQLFDPDLWWHITIGRWILSHHTVPFMEYWNAYALGTPWIAYSWSNEAAFALAEQLGGLHGLLVLQLALGILLVFSLCWSYGRVAGDFVFGALLGIFIALGCVTHFHLRPQTVAWLCFIGVFYGSYRVAEDGYTKRHLLLIALSLIMWANSHITTVFGLLTLVLVASSKQRLQQSVITHVTFLLAMVACTFLTPYLGAEWGIFFGKADHPFTHSTIIEFGPATILDYVAGVCLLLMTLLGSLVWQNKLYPPFGMLVCTLVLVIGGAAVIKFMPFALIALGFCIASVLRQVKLDSSESTPSLVEGLVRLRKLTVELTGTGSAFFLLALAIVNVRTLWIAPLDKERVPVAAVDFVIKNRLPHPIANAFGEGGYLMYRLSDEAGDIIHNVSIDGRTNVNPPEVSLAYQLAYQGSQGWSRYIELVNPQTVLWKNKSPLSSLLLLSDEWCRVYKDGSTFTGYSVFLKKVEKETEFSELVAEGC
jgi:hypothetical protein